jgi:hypothetical protein
MPDILEQLRQREEELNGLRAKEDRRQGREEQLMKQLKDEYKLTSIEEAIALKVQLEATVADRNQKLQDLEKEMAGIVTAAKAPKEVGTCG